MAALLLDVGGGHEGGPDQQKHSGFILPIIRTLKQRARKHAEAEHAARTDQRQRGENQNDSVAQSKRIFQCRDKPRAGRGNRRGGSIRKRTMHHAEMSDASFSNLAAVAVLAPKSFQAVSRAMSRHLLTVA